MARLVQQYIVSLIVYVAMFGQMSYADKEPFLTMAADQRRQYDNALAARCGSG